MTPSWRKPVGALVIVALLTLWAGLCVTLIGRLPKLHWAVELALYLVAGFAWLWLLPMRRLLLWMETGRWR